MLKRILIIWLIANFVIVSLASWMVGRWYLGWQGMPVVGMIAELCLIMIPNAVLPIIVLRYWWPETIDDLRDALGWRWRGWRCVVAGVVAFLIAILLTSAITRWFGESIPYNLAETESNSGITIEQASDVLKIVGLLAGLLVFVVITVVGEETMFRGWIQTQVGSRYGAWVGLFLAVLLFGLRHLPADLFYAQIWDATPRMWLARQLQLYAGAVCFGLARYFGRSTYASAITHVLFFGVVLFV
jgi:membrane protease YdiL (CAAX protease family)